MTASRDAVKVRATFRLDRQSPDVPATYGSNSHSHVTAHGPTVLVIDDNDGLVKLVQRYLTDRDCRVIAATNGEEGLRLAQELLPDAIVLDVMMPEMDGWELLQRLRNRPQTATIPVIICSVISDPELAYSLGAALSLPKPISRRDVMDALHQLGVM